MKALVVTNDFPPKVGGINYYVAHLVRWLPEGEVTVFASDWPGAERFDATFPHPVVRWPSESMYPTPGAVDRAVELVVETGADIVLFGAAMPLAMMGRTIERRTGVPYAAFTHGVEIWAAKVPVAHRALLNLGEGASVLMAVSGWAAEHLREAVGPGPRVELLPPGIDADLFHPGVSDEIVRRRHGLGDAPVVCCVSRLTLRKGQDRIIRALPEVAAEFPEVRFLIVGSGPDEERLRSLARRKGVEERVTFAGEVSYDELPGYFRAGDVFAMPCRTRKWGLEVEAFGAVFLQASAVGRPCVGGDSGGAPEAVIDGETGVVVDGTDDAAVADGILRLLRDPELAAKMGRAGADRVHREFTWPALSSRLRGLLVDAAAR
ncbi:MAG TPA: glycosyltransferase family 4 protein [Actinomycetota bacterium]|nr:glycosyltransferase family 4 protein [Actinomycetota bacterium]